MRVAYVTPYYNGECDGRYGRFHDWIHTARDMDNPPFEFDVLAFTASNYDSTLGIQPGQYLGDATSLWGTKKNKIEFMLNAPMIHQVLRNGDYDLIHVLVLDAVVYPTVISSLPDVPVIVGPDIAGWSPVRDVPYWEETVTQQTKNHLRFVFKNILGKHAPYDHALAFGQHHKQILESFSIPGEKITTLKPGVTDQFLANDESTGTDTRSDNEVPEILYVGDFSEHKGYPLFLRALSRLERSVTARVIGSGNPRHDLIKSLGLEDIVTIEGFIPRNELPQYYKQASLYVVPSIDETAGTNTQIEALASGTPVVVTDAPGLNEYAPPDASVFFSPRDPPALQDALLTALNNLDNLTASARIHAPDFLATEPLAQLDETYRELVESKAGDT